MSLKLINQDPSEIILSFSTEKQMTLWYQEILQASEELKKIFKIKKSVEGVEGLDSVTSKESNALDSFRSNEFYQNDYNNKINKSADLDKSMILYKDDNKLTDDDINHLNSANNLNSSRDSNYIKNEFANTNKEEKEFNMKENIHKLELKTAKLIEEFKETDSPTKAYYIKAEINKIKECMNRLNTHLRINSMNQYSQTNQYNKNNIKKKLSGNKVKKRQMSTCLEVDLENLDINYNNNKNHNNNDVKNLTYLPNTIKNISDDNIAETSKNRDPHYSQFNYFNNKISYEAPKSTKSRYTINNKFNKSNTKKNINLLAPPKNQLEEVNI